MILKADIRNDSQAIHLIQYFMKEEQSSQLLSRIGRCDVEKIWIKEVGSDRELKGITQQRLS
jgi:hypothetical protein